jgi:hypothetical protein
MEGWKPHSSECGVVSSLCAPTVSGMALQCAGWWHSGREGRTGLEVIEETSPCWPDVTTSSCASVV